MRAGLTAVVIRRLTEVQRWVEESVPLSATCCSASGICTTCVPKSAASSASCAGTVRSGTRRRALPCEKAGRGDLPDVADRWDEVGRTAERAVFVPVGSFTEELYRKATAASSLDGLCGVLERPFPQWARELRRFLAQPHEPESALRECELWLENLHFQGLLASACRAVSRDARRLIRRYVTLLIDMTNLRTALRFLDGISAGRRSGTARARWHAVGSRLRDHAAGGCRRANLPRAAGRAADRRAGAGNVIVYQCGARLGVRAASGWELLRFEKRLARRDPVSVALPLYYLARARNE